MKHTLATLFLLSNLLWSHLSWGLSPHDPQGIENKIQGDLDNLLSKILPREQFLVTTAADITTRLEKKVLEGEVLTAETPLQESVFVPTMPGFIPETESKPAKLPAQTRQTYRMVEIPEVSLVKIQVTFDDTVPETTVTRSKSLIQHYLKSLAPLKIQYSFGHIPMLKPEKPEKKEVATSPDKSDKDERNIMKFSLIVIGFLLTLVLIRVLFPATQQSSPPNRILRPPVQPEAPSPTSHRTPRQAATPPESHTPREEFLGKLIAHASYFRNFYRNMTLEEQQELAALLDGPGYRNLLQGLNLPEAPISDAGDFSEENLKKYERDFTEYVKSARWQDRQFFGFVHALSQEQLLSLVLHEAPLTVCALLRFLKPSQSAFVLDTLTEERRRQVLSYIPQVNEMAFSQLADIEKKLRENIHRLPTTLLGSAKEDILFWGNVIGEAEHSEDILDVMEKTNPGITPKLAKYRFRLEDAASLPDALLGKALKEVDNEELSLALAACSDDVVEVFLDSLSPKRRELIHKQTRQSRGLSAESSQAAKNNLTRKIRELIT